MTKAQLEALLEMKKIEAKEMIEIMNNRSYNQIAKAKRVTYDERDSKQVIEEIKALEYVISDEGALMAVENGKYWNDYVSTFTYM